MGETEQKTPELCPGQVGDGLAAGSAELLLLSLQQLGSHCLLPAGGLYLGKVCPDVADSLRTCSSRRPTLQPRTQQSGCCVGSEFFQK